MVNCYYVINRNTGKVMFRGKKRDVNKFIREHSNMNLAIVSLKDYNSAMYEAIRIGGDMTEIKILKKRGVI